MTDAPEIHVLDHKVRLLQPLNGFRTSLDSVMLAAACRADAASRVLDLGAGVGGASFCLLWRVPGCHVTGVEIQNGNVALAVKNIGLNDREGRAEFICGDVRAYRSPDRFDHVICNPPFMEEGAHTKSHHPERATALGNEEGAMLDDWIRATFDNLTSGGGFTIIHRADAVDRILQAMGRKFGAVEIIPLYSREGEEAKRVIIRAVKDRRTPARILPGISLHDDAGWTAAADAILRDGAAIG